MPSLSEDEWVLRRRITKWLRYFWARHRAKYPNKQDIAAAIGYQAQIIGAYLNGTRDGGPGLDALPGMHGLGADLNVILLRDPTEDELAIAGSPERPPGEATSPHRTAVPDQAPGRGRQKKSAGH